MDHACLYLSDEQETQLSGLFSQGPFDQPVSRSAHSATMILATSHPLSGMTSTFHQSLMAQDWPALFPTFLLRRECNRQQGDLREIL
uniref:Uncharacterized protein n=1 Tax=Arundo donax TaxID=35708 RepID=A0A0A9EZQ4_ARUDO